MDKVKLYAIHDEKLPTALESLGLARKYERGELKCKFCGLVITDDNFYGYFPQSGDIKFVCEAPDCVSQFMRLIEEGIIGT